MYPPVPVHHLATPPGVVPSSHGVDLTLPELAQALPWRQTVGGSQ